MAVKNYTFTGVCRWAKVFEEWRENVDWQGQPYDYEALYKIDLILDKEQRKLLKDSGSALKGKFDDDGNFVATFKRKHKGPFEKASGPPKVTKADGSKWDIEADGVIGNGSKVEIVVEVYDTKMAPGTRLVSVRVLEHVPYVKEEHDEDQAA